MWSKHALPGILIISCVSTLGQADIIPPDIILQGHLYKVNCICYNKSGDLLASCGWDNTVRLWDMTTFKEKQVFQGHEDNVWKVMFSPDEKFLISGGMDATMIVWDIQTGEAVQRITVKPKYVIKKGMDPEIEYTLPNSLTPGAFSRDGSILFTGSTDGLIRIFDMHRFQFTDTLFGHRGAVSNLAVSGDGSLLASGSWENELFIWDLRRYEILHRLKSEQHSAYSLKFLNNDRYLLGAGGSSINIWDTESVTIIRRFTGQRALQRCELSPDGRYLASCTEDFSVWLREYETGEVLWKYRGPKMEIATLAFSPDGKWLAVGIPESDILLWELNTLVRKVE
jgi:WD40 repeat protein